MKTLHIAAFILAVAGGLNWGLVGLFNYNLVQSALGPLGLENIVYVLVGLSALYLGLTHMGDCKVCSSKK